MFNGYFLIPFFTYKFYFSCFCFSKTCLDFSTDCYPATYRFYYSSLCFHNIYLNPLYAELNLICHLLALLGAHHILHVSRIRVNLDVYTFCILFFILFIFYFILLSNLLLSLTHIIQRISLA
jgi:hypothetical protein